MKRIIIKNYVYIPRANFTIRHTNADLSWPLRISTWLYFST